MSVLPRTFYLRDTVIVARELLGKRLVRYLDRTRLSGIIVETEAYTENDKASHAYRGVTLRTRPMFGEGGISYVYFIYGMYYCLNVVTEPAGIGAAVLIRAVEPQEGLEAMQIFRKNRDVTHLTNGPGKLAQAFNISKTENALDLTTGKIITIEDAEVSPQSIVTTTRIGIKNDSHRPYRFYVEGNRFVSQK